jgi:hypothetical protein
MTYILFTDMAMDQDGNALPSRQSRQMEKRLSQRHVRRGYHLRRHRNDHDGGPTGILTDDEGDNDADDRADIEANALTICAYPTASIGKASEALEIATRDRATEGIIYTQVTEFEAGVTYYTYDPSTGKYTALAADTDPAELSAAGTAIYAAAPGLVDDPMELLLVNPGTAETPAAEDAFCGGAWLRSISGSTYLSDTAVTGGTLVFTAEAGDVIADDLTLSGASGSVTTVMITVENGNVVFDELTIARKR